MTAHKGLVDVKSEPGKGSSFMLTFPKRVEG
jgi:signal transduction histidine kinase